MGKLFSPAQAKAIYKEFLNSGKTKTDFCKEKKIGKSTLYKWQQQLGESVSAKTALLKEILITKPSKIAEPLGNLEPIQIILVNGTKINVPPNFCNPSLKLILQNLG